MHTNSQAPSPATTIAERLSGGEPYIITFGGQATPWRQTLADLVSLDHALAADVVAGDPARGPRPAPPAVAAPRTTPTKSALATTGPSIAVAVVAAGLLGAGAVLVMRRRQAS